MKKRDDNQPEVQPVSPQSAKVTKEPASETGMQPSSFDLNKIFTSINLDTLSLQTSSKQTPQANRENLHRIFTIPEDENSTLSKIEQQISDNLDGFLKETIVAKVKDVDELEQFFIDHQVPEEPVFVSEHADFLLKYVVPHSVHTASPTFIGHMTSALPYFMMPLSKILIALNQNLVKIETSKVFTPLERQVIGQIHHLIYHFSEDFYASSLHDSGQSLGVFCSGGTLANITALWVARNQAFQATDDFEGIQQVGLVKALKHYGYQDVVVLVSERGHYSIAKTADLLGLGKNNVIKIPVDDKQKIKIDCLKAKCEKLRKDNIKILAIVGIAGTTETGNVDELSTIAEIARQYRAHFHVDAAWGGATLFSEQYKDLLAGIELADSVTIDAHKQFYVPMGAAMVCFRSPHSPRTIEQYANYVLRKDSKDLGRYSLEGSRSGMALMVYSGLKIISRKGYEVLIDLGIEKAKTFAEMIRAHEDFELTTEPELNLLTYRFVPYQIQRRWHEYGQDKMELLNQQLNLLTRRIQKIQRSRGKSFVSRTKLNLIQHHNQPVVVFRVVLANPLTTYMMLAEILSEQSYIARDNNIKSLINAYIEQ